MKTSKTIRNFKYLIITIINFLALYIAKIYYEYIDNLEYNGVTNYDSSTDINYKSFLDFNTNQQKILANVLLISVIISLVMIIKKIKIFKSGIEKLIIGVWFIYTISIIIGLIDRHMYGDYAYKIYNTYFINYLLFIPHLFLIYKFTFIGETVDITKEIKQNEKNKFTNNLDDLKKLLELGHITHEEFNSKKETILKKKIESEIIFTEEFKLLKKTKESGLINEIEFETKFKNLIEKNYQFEKTL